MIVAAVLLLSGCGGHTSDRDQILKVIRAYASATDRLDLAGQCRLLTPKARATLVEDVRWLQLDPAFRSFMLATSHPASTCIGALRAAKWPYRGQRKPGLTAQPGAWDNLDDARVSIKDGRADVTELRIPMTGPSLVLMDLDGEWRIANSPL